jgi:hypothetical protein
MRSTIDLWMNSRLCIGGICRRPAGGLGVGTASLATFDTALAAEARKRGVPLEA